MATYLISGATGFIGSALSASLAADGHRVVVLTRRRPRSGAEIPWDPESGALDPSLLDAARPDVVINLAGEPIAQRWTDARKQRIVASRVAGTMALSTALAAMSVKPRALVSGSAIGYYGADRGDELLDEESAPAADFLARTAASWEDATRPAASAGIRVAISRTGLVLGEHGGALARMLPPFRLGAGGRIGSGRQWMSWISLADQVAALRFLADTDAASGPFNLVAPNPERNTEFTATLGRVLGRPAIVPVPAIALRFAFGEMADATILASQRVVPKKLAGAGFTFRHPRLEAALRYELRR